MNRNHNSLFSRNEVSSNDVDLPPTSTISSEPRSGGGKTVGGTSDESITGNTNTTTSSDGNGSPSFTPIAICGMACRLPGGIHSPQELWDFLLSKGDARIRIPETRYNISAYHSDTKKPGSTVSEYGYFLDESVDLGALDTSFFSMARGELERLDPQQRILLEVARESLDDAGEVHWKGKNIGVYVGSFGNDWYDLFNSDAQKYGMYQVSTTHDFSLSNRVSYEMDLRGPRYECFPVYVWVFYLD